MRRPWFWVVVDVVGIASALAVLVVAARLEPDPRGFGTHDQLGLAPCGYLLLTGSPCVSCGMTTCFANMIRGRVVAAFAANPAGIPLFLLTLSAPFWFGYALVGGRDPFGFLSRRGGQIGLWTLLGIIIGTWCLRVAL